MCLCFHSFNTRSQSTAEHPNIFVQSSEKFPSSFHQDRPSEQGRQDLPPGSVERFRFPLISPVCGSRGGQARVERAGEGTTAGSREPKGRWVILEAGDITLPGSRAGQA